MSRVLALAEKTTHLFYDTVADSVLRHLGLGVLVGALGPVALNFLVAA